MTERLASFISNRASTMEEIVKACLSGEVPMDIACVISSKPTAEGILRARKLGIADRDIVIIDPNNFRGGDKKIDQYGFGMAILKELRKRGVTVFTQNGWIPLTPEVVIDEYPQTSFNQHPAPVPEFGGQWMYGRTPHAAVIYFRNMVKRKIWTEAVAQRVGYYYDEGAIVKSERLDVDDDITFNQLEEILLPVEHRVQIELLKDVAKGNVKEEVNREPLVQPGEEAMLHAAKIMAILFFPPKNILDDYPTFNYLRRHIGIQMRKFNISPILYQAEWSQST